MKTDKIIYTVYQLNEKRNKLGNPYIGFSDNLIRRSKQWKRELELDYIPNLIPVYFSTDEDQAFDWEQNKKVKTGWRREPSLSHQKNMRKKAHVAVSKSEKVKEQRIQIGKKSGAKNVESGQLQRISSLGGIIGMQSPNNVNKQKRKCIYCGFETTPGNIGRHHNENCRFK